MIPAVAVIGANGHGKWHRRAIAAAQSEGRLKLVALADVQPVEQAEAPVFTDHRALLSATRPDAVVICTPPHTHLPIALDVLAAGCDVLLEKPPVRTLEEHRTLLAAVEASGRACQVGFQALGSQASARLVAATREQAMGPVSGITAVASWKRTDAYYGRAQWAGRRSVGGRPVVDGTLVNPLAHALMECLVVARAAGSGGPARIEVERYRTREIEVDDTAFARITFANGLPMVIGATLAGEDFIAGEVTVTGPAGRAQLEYPTDRLALPGEADLIEVPGRTDLLANLLAHRADPAGAALLSPLAGTADFTAVLEALTAPDRPLPTLLGDPEVTATGEGPDRIQVISGINAVLGEVAESGLLPSELGIPWAQPPWTAEIRL